MARLMFAFRVRAEPNVDGIRALRAWLKRGLRDFGLRCVELQQVNEKENTMDVRKYTAGLILPENLRDGPRQERIIRVYMNDKYDYPVIEFASGNELIAFPSIGRVLVRAYGYESEDWLGHVVELALGTYTNKDGDAEEIVTIKAISPREGVGNGGTQRVDPAQLPAPMKKDDPDDEVPFV